MGLQMDRVGVTSGHETASCGHLEVASPLVFRTLNEGVGDLAPPHIGPNVLESMELSVDNRPLTDCVEGADCGCGATITLGPDDELGTRQRTIYGTRAWVESYGRRNAVESANAPIKVHYAQLCRGSIRAFGQLTHGLLVSIILSTVNIALLDTIYGIDAGKPLPDDAPITAREPRTQAVHRKPRRFQRPARTPKAQPMNDGPSTNAGDWTAVR